MAELFDGAVVKRNFRTAIPNTSLWNKTTLLFIGGENEYDHETFVPKFLNACLETMGSCPELKVVLISTDRDEAQMERYFKTLRDDWLCLEYADPLRLQLIDIHMSLKPNELLPALLMVKVPPFRGNPLNSGNFVPVKTHFMAADDKKKLFRSWCDTYKRPPNPP